MKTHFGYILLPAAGMSGSCSEKTHEIFEKEGIEAVSLQVITIEADSAEYHYGMVIEDITASRKIILQNTVRKRFA